MRTRRRRSLVEELMAAEDPAARRWKTCLHEAGHAVAGRRLLKRTVTAAVYGDDMGAAYIGTNDVIPRTYEEALSIAAGPAAEALADLHTAPQVSPPPPALATAYPESTAPLVAQLRQSPPDHVAIARWCIRGLERQPERWANRFHWIHREAQFFVGRHQQEIVRAAVGLYERGIVTLPA